MPGYRYGAVLVLLAMTFVVMAAGPPDGYTRVITVVLQGLTLMAALLASRVSRRLFRLAALVTLVSFIAAIVSVIVGNGERSERRVLPAQRAPRRDGAGRHRRVRCGAAASSTSTPCMGAICIYVLLGMMFAFVYAAIDAMSSGPFFVQTAHATAPDFLYFSFITQTTVGYGDFTASGDLGARSRCSRR